MVDPKQIPDEVVEAAAKELAYTNGWRNEQGIAVCEPVARSIIAAALAAWPNNIFDHQYRNGRDYNSLILPLQEPRT